LPLEEGLVFKVMASAYRHGVLDKFMSITGDALDSAMLETGRQMGGLVNMLDETRERTVMKANNLLSRTGLVLKLAASGPVMSVASRSLDVHAVRNVVKGVMARKLVKAIEAQAAAIPAAGRARGV
jgi:hypothetical protein